MDFLRFKFYRLKRDNTQIYYKCSLPFYLAFLFPFPIAGGNLAASNIRNLECPSYEVYLIDYGCGKFNKKVHIME